MKKIIHSDAVKKYGQQNTSHNPRNKGFLGVTLFALVLLVNVVFASPLEEKLRGMSPREQVEYLNSQMAMERLFIDKGSCSDQLDQDI